ncbi:MAG TPA: nitroreductase family deazaflavin-dependent oxidoreductase [Acidimicrobiia bacterium]
MSRPSDDELALHRTIDLTTLGRRSGRPSRIEIWWFYIDGSFFITGTPGPRDWYANVLADPNVTIHAGEHDLPATAQLVTDVETRSKVFDSELTRWYSSQSQRQRLIDESPMVEIVF